MKILFLVKRVIEGLGKGIAIITSRLQDKDVILDGPFVDETLNDDDSISLN